MQAGQRGVLTSVDWGMPKEEVVKELLGPCQVGQQGTLRSSHRHAQCAVALGLQGMG